jgi:RNA polymerase sigma factor (sigma-70 family)
LEASTSSGTTRRAGFIAGIRTPLLRHQPDARLLELTRRGNEAAFETLFHRYRTRLVAFAHQLLGASSTDAEDVVQEVMVAANHAMVADDRAIEVRPWLYKITRNRCLNHLRDQSAARRPPVNGDGQDQELLDRAMSHGPSTAEQVDRQAELRLLVDDVCSLPEAQRTALVLREIDGLSYQEVGEAMDTSVSSVKSLLVRARLGLIDIAEGRELSCEDVRISLALTEQKLGGLTGPERAHVRSCERCTTVKKRLRGTSRNLAAIAPVGLLGPVEGAIGAVGIGAGSATAIGGGGAAAGGALAGAGLAVKGIVAALAVGVIAAGSAYIPGIGSRASEQSGAAQPASAQPFDAGSVAAGAAATGSESGADAGRGAGAGEAAVEVGPQSTSQAVVIDDGSSAAAAVELDSRDRGGDAESAESRGRPDGVIEVSEPVTVQAPTPVPAPEPEPAPLPPKDETTDPATDPAEPSGAVDPQSEPASQPQAAPAPQKPGENA